MYTEATYEKHPSDMFNGNPLTETLQFHLDANQFHESIQKTTSLSANFRDLPDFYQKAELNSLIKFHCPLPDAWAIYSSIGSLLLNGYKDRNPFQPTSTQLVNELSSAIRERAKFKNEFTTTTAPSSVVVGPSGSGKTTLVRNNLLAIPQTIQHQNFEGEPFNAVQLVWLSFDMPSTNSPKALALSFFKAVDKALSTTYYDQWTSNSKMSVDTHYLQMQLIAATHHLGIVHIDEIQFIKNYGKSDKSPNLATLESLFNKIGVPVILSTTEHGLSLFEVSESIDPKLGKDGTTCRRMLNDQEFRIKPLKFESKKSQEYLSNLFPESIIKGSRDKEEEFLTLFFALSCGLPAYMNRLAMLYNRFHLQLVNSGRKVNTFNPALLEKVYKNQFKLIEPALADFRRGNLQAYEKQVSPVLKHLKKTNPEEWG